MRDFFLFAFRNVKHRKLRTWLTILGIVIGIASVVALISLSAGLENAVTEQFSKIGADRIFIIPGKAFMAAGAAAGVKGLTTEDVDVVKSLREVDKVNSYLVSVDQVKFRHETKIAKYIYGVDTENIEDFWKAYDHQLEMGKFFKKGEKNSAILGYKAAHDLFDRDVKLNDIIEINNTKFKVIGIFNPIGTEQDDYSISLPLDTVREIYNKPKEVSIIEIKVKKGVGLPYLAEKIKRKMKRKRSDDNFQVFTPDQLMRQFSSILNIIKIVLGGIAAISLFIGSLGIMNVMYTNVLERTREIGIMKSIGASYTQILSIFLLESTLISLVGGILGIILGFIISFSVEKIALLLGFTLLKIKLDLKLILLMLVFSLFIGIISGYFPARRAAKLNPVNALRG